MAASRNKLDMSHGFMKSIIKNQVDRDHYNSEMTTKKQETPKSSATRQSAKVRKPDQAIYTPPYSRKSGGENSQNVLFTLEFCDEAKNLHTFPVYKGETEASVSKKVAMEINLPPDLTHALQVRLVEEFRKFEGV